MTTTSNDEAHSQDRASPVFTRFRSMRLQSVSKSEKFIEENTFSICGKGKSKSGRAVEKAELQHYFTEEENMSKRIQVSIALCGQEKK